MPDSQDSHGGSRPGAGRKPGSGKFGEPTTIMRVPASQKAVILDFLDSYQRKQAARQPFDVLADFEFLAADSRPMHLPLFGSKVPAGIPSPADGHVEKRLNPNDFLVDQQHATFFVTIQGNSMVDIGLMPGDKAVVDRSKRPTVGDIVLAMVDGEFTIKTLGRTKAGAPRLLPANASGGFVPIEIKDGMAFEIWGVVTGSFRRFK